MLCCVAVCPNPDLEQLARTHTNIHRKSNGRITTGVSKVGFFNKKKGPVRRTTWKRTKNNTAKKRIKNINHEENNQGDSRYRFELYNQEENRQKRIAEDDW